MAATIVTAAVSARPLALPCATVERTSRGTQHLLASPHWRTFLVSHVFVLRSPSLRTALNMSAASPPLTENHVIHRGDLPDLPSESRGTWHMAETVRGATPHTPDRAHRRQSAPRGSGGAQWPELDDPTTRQPELDDCQRMGTLFGMINKCLRGVGFSQMYFGDKIVEPVVIMVFWMLLWFLGIQALGLVGTLCIIIIYIQD